MVTVPKPPYPQQRHVLARRGNRFWVWDTPACSPRSTVRVEDTTLEDLFVGVTT